MSSRAVLVTFERYQKERLAFITAIADMSRNTQNIEALTQAGAMTLLKALLHDNVPSIQHSSMLTMGRMAQSNELLAQEIANNDVIPHLIKSLTEENKYRKQSASFCIRSIAKHSAHLAQVVIDGGALKPLVKCLEAFDPHVKESAAWTLGYIASQSTDIARQVADANAIPLLISCLQEPDINVKRIAASALSDISKFVPELAQMVVDFGAITHLVPLMTDNDAKLRRQVCGCLSQIAKHSTDLAEIVVEAEIFPGILTCLKYPDGHVRKHAACVIRDISKHTPELAQLVVSHGSVAVLIDYLNQSKSHFRIPGILALGYIAAFSETLAMTVIAEKGYLPVIDSIREDCEEHIKGAATWTLGQLGRHSTEHAKTISESGILLDILEMESKKDTSEDLSSKCRRSLKLIIPKLMHLSTLDSLVQKPVPEGIMKLILEQLSKVLSEDPSCRSKFVHSGGFVKVQEMAEDPESCLREELNAINSNYPEEIVMYYSPSYSQKLLEKLDEGITQPVTV